MAPTGKIYSLLKQALSTLPKTEVFCDTGFFNITVANKNQFVPEFVFIWDGVREYYRMYIHVGGTVKGKVCAGYCICTIGSVLAAAGFIVLYQFLHKHRANNKNLD